MNNLHFSLLIIALIVASLTMIFRIFSWWIIILGFPEKMRESRKRKSNNLKTNFYTNHFKYAKFRFVDGFKDTDRNSCGYYDITNNKIHINLSSIAFLENRQKVLISQICNTLEHEILHSTTTLETTKFHVEKARHFKNNFKKLGFFEKIKASSILKNYIRKNFNYEDVADEVIIRKLMGERW